MVYHGRVKNGVVVLDQSNALPEGTEVRIEPVADRPRRTLAERFADIIGGATDLPEDIARNHGAFWRTYSVDEIAEVQKVPVVESLDDMLGGWPEDELDDGFEVAIADWRRAELEPRDE